jgi:hypothetical protein
MAMGGRGIFRDTQKVDMPNYQRSNEWTTRRASHLKATKYRESSTGDILEREDKAARQTR